MVLIGRVCAALIVCVVLIGRVCAALIVCGFNRTSVRCSDSVCGFNPTSVGCSDSVCGFNPTSVGCSDSVCGFNRTSVRCSDSVWCKASRPPCPPARCPPPGVGKGRKEMFYLTTHSTHFIYGYMASDIWLRTILIVRKKTRCRHIGYIFRLAVRVLLYALSHKQDSTYHGLCYTSRGALAGTRNSSGVRKFCIYDYTTDKNGCQVCKCKSKSKHYVYK